MRIAYLDHAVNVIQRDPDGRPLFDGPSIFSPGLVDVDIYPELAPHSYGGSDRHDPPIFELRRCCQACENSWKLQP